MGKERACGHEARESSGVPLIEDAPASSFAHTAVRYRASTDEYVFRLRVPAGHVYNLEVSAADAGGSRENAARICRLCYDRWRQEKPETML